MVHAEASNFATGATKAEAYQQVLEQAEALFEGQRNWVCNLANTASLLHHALHALPSPSNATNWTGFYVRDPETPSQLILGPFMGKVACQTIAIKDGSGVCGTAAARKETQLVPDVNQFPGHLACDADSASEVVVPIFDKAGDVVAIIDIDCAEKSGFDEEDKKWLEQVADLLGRSCDWK